MEAIAYLKYDRKSVIFLIVERPELIVYSQNDLQLCFLRDSIQMSIHLFNIPLESVLCLRTFEFHSTKVSER